MIRDTAYDGILKRARADLHTRFVTWADVANRDRGVEFEEILGYHLEQAWRYLSELGPLDERGREIGEDASRRLASAGRRAFARGDIPGAASLLGRAAALLPVDHRERLRLLPEHGEALLLTGRYDEASAVLDEAIARPDEAPAAAARATLVRMLVGLRTGDAGSWRRETVDRTIAAARDVFAAEGDESGLAMAYRLLAWSAGTACRFGDAADASALAVEHARRAGDARQAIRAATGVRRRRAASGRRTSTRRSPAASRASTRRRATGSRRATSSRSWRGCTRCRERSTTRGSSSAVRARCSPSSASTSTSRAPTWRRGGSRCSRATSTRRRRRFAGRTTRSSRGARRTCARPWPGCSRRRCSSAGRRSRRWRSSATQSQELADDDDVDSQAVWRRVRGRVLAQRGEHAAAERIIREALALLEPTDATLFQLQAELDLGDVLAAADRTDDARAAYEAARELAERKGGVVLLGAVLRRLEALDAAPA